MTREKLTNKALADKLDYSCNYVSQIRAGSMIPGLKLGIAICELFPGEIALADLGINIDPGLLVRAESPAPAESPADAAPASPDAA